MNAVSSSSFPNIIQLATVCSWNSFLLCMVYTAIGLLTWEKPSMSEGARLLSFGHNCIVFFSELLSYHNKLHMALQ